MPRGGSSTVHIYTQTVHRTTKSTQTVHITTQLIHGTTQLKKSAGRVPSLTSYTLAFALQLREKHGKTSVRVSQYTITIQTIKTRNKHHLRYHSTNEL